MPQFSWTRPCSERAFHEQVTQTVNLPVQVRPHHLVRAGTAGIALQRGHGRAQVLAHALHRTTALPFAQRARLLLPVLFTSLALLACSIGGPVFFHINLSKLNDLLVISDGEKCCQYAEFSLLSRSAFGIMGDQALIIG